MNKQQLASKIWESANKMRSKIEANEYKDYILGFIFYKFISDKEEDLLKSIGWTEENYSYLVESDSETVAFCQNKLGYFISNDNLFSTWLKKGSDFKASDVTDALNAFERLIDQKHKKVYEKIFFTLQTGLSKLGDTSNAQTKAISNLIQLIKDIPMDGKQDYDVLGFIYEYLISNFAANAGKKAGEFYTPYEVSVLMSEIVAEHLKNKDKISIYDPTSGSGSLLINIGKAISKHMDNKNNIVYYAQELKENTYNLTRMNLVMRGIIPDNIYTRNGDTLAEDWPRDDSETPPVLRVDAVVSNPPYSQAWEPADKESDPRYKNYGIAPKSKADYAFLLHDLYHIEHEGIMTIVLPHGVLFRGGEEEKIRTNLIEYNNIDTIIGLPSNIFFGTGIPTIIMVLKPKRVNEDVLIIDASKGFVKEGKNNKLRASDIKRIVDTVKNRVSIPKFSKVVSKEQIRANGYNLNIPRYVDSSEKAEAWDIYASLFGGIPNTEVEEFSCYWAAFDGLKEDIFEESGIPYSRIKVEDIETAIHNNKSVENFIDNYSKNFDGFDTYLKEKLINNMSEIKVVKAEAEIGDEIFERMKNIPLVDFYQAYQNLDDIWKKVSTDLEIIQTEGKESIKIVDPNMVIKKKDGKESEVQDGWVGRIIPFELVQKTLLADMSESLASKENRLAQISSLYEELLDEFSEDEKSEYSACFNDDNTAFVNSEITKQAKAILKNRIAYDKNSIEAKILKVNSIISEEKDIKAEIKKESVALITATKDKIENLTDEEVVDLLIEKWIAPLLKSLKEIPASILSESGQKINSLSKKYQTTLIDLEEEIYQIEDSLCEMINDLDGDEYDMLGLKEFQKLLKGE